MKDRKDPGKGSHWAKHSPSTAPVGWGSVDERFMTKKVLTGVVAGRTLHEREDKHQNLIAF